MLETISIESAKKHIPVPSTQDDLSQDESHIRIVINVPKKVLLAEKMDEITFAHELRLLAAVKLYELGRLSSGRAAELANMPRVEFLLTLNRYKVFPFAAELNDLEQHYA
jgi:predicted HTH domain antitoxin